MNWWVLTYHDHARSLHHLLVVVRTNDPAHLFMAWDRHEPTHRPIWRNVRGKLIFCGYSYWWADPTITEQNEPLATFYHTFGPLTLAAADHVWYYILSLPTPAQRACQSALFHVWPPELHAWTSKVYIGTRLKGIYYTDSFTGPGGQHPTWTTVNEGLHSDIIWQLEPDPFGLAYRMYALAGAPGDRTLYVRTPSLTPSWLELLTNAAAVALTGAASGQLCWIATNLYFPGYLYVLFNSAIADVGIWCLRSQDYGQTWTAHQIYAGLMNYNAGNLSLGLLQGTSPYGPGTVLYAALNTHITAPVTLWLSLNHGQSWTGRDSIGVSAQQPVCLADPSDQSIVYIGGFVNPANPRELYRSHTHGTNLVSVDGLLHLGSMNGPYYGQFWINPTDHELATALAGNHLYTTSDYCLNWTDRGNILHTVKRLAVLWENPHHFYLGRRVSGTPAPPYSNCHVIFTSEDYGATMYGKAGAWAYSPTGHSDSIPYNCGGICRQGIQLFPPY